MTSDDDVVAVILDLDSTEKGKGELTFALSEVSLVCAVQIVTDRTQVFFLLLFFLNNNST